MSSYAKPWTKAEIATIRRHAQTHTKAQVAAMLEGRSKRAVEEISSKLRIRFQKHGDVYHKSKLTTQQVMEAFALRQQGWTWDELGARYGVNESTVRLALNFATHYHDTLPLLLDLTA